MCSVEFRDTIDLRVLFTRWLMTRTNEGSRFDGRTASLFLRVPFRSLSQRVSERVEFVETQKSVSAAIKNIEQLQQSILFLLTVRRHDFLFAGASSTLLTFVIFFWDFDGG